MAEARELIGPRGFEEAFQKDKRYTVEIEKTETVNISGTHVKYAIIRVINEID